MTSSQPNAKVLLRGDDGEVETLWAFDLGADQYRLDNLPFYAYAVSLGDVVLAPLDKDEGFPVLDSVVEKSGNRTVRVIFEEEVMQKSSSQNVLDGVRALGCSYEGANRRLIAINVPPEVDLQCVCEYLTQHGVMWENADPTYESLYSVQAP